MLKTSAVAEPRRLTLHAGDGVPLAVDARGDARDPALVFAHGFGQTRHAWNATTAALAEAGWRCLTMDARGHGDSGWRGDGHYDFSQFVDDLVRLARVPEQKPILVGASMGGLLGLVAQAEHAVFRALVLVDITPRWEAAGVERVLTFMRAHPQGFANVEEASAAIANYLPQRAQRYRRDPGRPERLRRLLVSDANGRLRWHWDPRLLDTIATGSERQQSRLLDAARRIHVPTLLVSGERSDVVSDDTIAEFLRCVPHAQHVCVSRATHMIAGDDNAAFTAAVARFVAPLRTNRIEDRP
ncbi:MAG: alpha/beta hydrolase [Xanthomonadaceae bacterium]|nr:alpha/beta hydrolase [Xanthomonadaceae bacterium]MDE1885288.1 alpha/beta hydrolase [Xanthomonadaceae bacterium]MDE1960270.1 alpha/beta hydrolase [Xanthomonadaceae bacterium]MDE2084507.1 alpha/beta hydrolase [Xanthomonadaceae bacterium]MDE2257122.1 alpha/beta hydrolase [Xanthomonadaceae bacterium]